MQQKTEDGLSCGPKKQLKISPGCIEPENMACSTQERSFNGRVQVLGVGYAPLLAPGGASNPILSCALLFLQNLETCYISELVEQSVQVMTDCYVKCCQRLPMPSYNSSRQHWQLTSKLHNIFHKLNLHSVYIII